MSIDWKYLKQQKKNLEITCNPLLLFSYNNINKSRGHIALRRGTSGLHCSNEGVERHLDRRVQQFKQT